MLHPYWSIKVFERGLRMVIGRAGRRSWGTGTNGIIKNDAMVPKK